MTPLLLAANILVVFIVLAQARRDSIRKMSREWRREGVDVEISDTWADTLWQRTPDTGWIMVRKNNRGKYIVGHSYSSFNNWPEMRTHVAMLEARLVANGVEPIVEVDE
jgi:hypothetical protein